MEKLAVNITNLQVRFGNQLELSIDSLRVYQQRWDRNNRGKWSQ